MDGSKNVLDKSDYFILRTIESFFFFLNIKGRIKCSEFEIHWKRENLRALKKKILKKKKLCANDCDYNKFKIEKL